MFIQFPIDTTVKGLSIVRATPNARIFNTDKKGSIILGPSNGPTIPSGELIGNFLLDLDNMLLLDKDGKLLYV